MQLPGIAYAQKSSPQVKSLVSMATIVDVLQTTIACNATADNNLKTIFATARADLLDRRYTKDDLIDVILLAHKCIQNQTIMPSKGKFKDKLTYKGSGKKTKL